MKYLIVNADDFGQATGINRAVVEAHRDGILTSATLMANGAAFDDAVALAKAHPTLGVGVHVNLVEGRPVSDAEDVRSLVDDDGQLLSKFALVRRHLCRRLRLEEVATEVRSQIQKVLDAGIQPTHVDSHQHMHVYPAFSRTIARTARSLGVPAIRLPIDRWQWQDIWTAKAGTLRTAAVNTAARWSRRSIVDSGLCICDRFAGTLRTGAISPAWLSAWIPQLLPGTTELMVHPAIADESLTSLNTRLTRQRQLEFSAITDRRVRQLIDETGIHLIHYGQLT